MCMWHMTSGMLVHIYMCLVIYIYSKWEEEGALWFIINMQVLILSLNELHKTFSARKGEREYRSIMDQP